VPTDQVRRSDAGGVTISEQQGTAGATSGATSATPLLGSRATEMPPEPQDTVGVRPDPKAVAEEQKRARDTGGEGEESKRGVEKGVKAAEGGEDHREKEGEEKEERKEGTESKEGKEGGGEAGKEGKEGEEDELSGVEVSGAAEAAANALALAFPSRIGAGTKGRVRAAIARAKALSLPSKGPSPRT